MDEINSKIDFENVFKELGGFGRFQLFVMLLACFSSFFAGLYVFASIFGGQVLSHRCKIPTCEEDVTLYDDDFLNFTTLWKAEDEEWDQCQMFPFKKSEANETLHFPPNSSNFQYISNNSSSTFVEFSFSTCHPNNFDSSGLVPCKEWVYDTTEFPSSVISEFTLTCNHKWMVPLENSCIMAGHLIGSIVIGAFADNYGRKLGLLLSAFLLCLGGIVSSSATNYYIFLIGRLIIGSGGMGCFQAAFITAIEFTGTKWRTLCGIMLNVPFSIGEVICGLVAYYIRSWRYLYLATSFPAVVLLSYWWVLPESPQWLIAKNRNEEAVKIFKKIAKFNKTKLPEGFEDQVMQMTPSIEEFDTKNKRSFWDMMRAPVTRRRSMILFYCWFVCAMLFYGLSSYVGSFSGNIFANYIFVAMAEVPGFTISAFASNAVGRKLMMISFFLIGGFTMILSSLLPSDFAITILVLSLTGKFSIAGAIGAIFVYTGEIYPTEYRAAAVGTCSMQGRIGGIMAPFISSLSQFYQPLPAFIFGISSFFAGLLFFTLPDTMGEKFPQTLEDCENIGKNQSWFRFKVFHPKKETTEE